MEYDPSLLAYCLSLVEKKVGLGSSKHWTNSDFEILHESIFSATGVRLSTSTLKRIWGKVSYQGVPQKATLNALACFVGYENYRVFQQTHREKKEPEQAAVNVQHFSEKPGKGMGRWKQRLSRGGIWTIGLATGFILSLLLAFSLSIKRSSGATVDPSQYAFSSHPLSSGIPNSVVFKFDVSRAPSDCLQIQQDWDERLRFTVKKDQRVATSIYYYPGFYNAKLLVDGVTVRTHELHIKTDGWLPLVEQEPVPVYFTSEDGRNGGAFGLSVDQLSSRNISMQPAAPWVSYFYVQEMGGLRGESFSLETGVRNTFSLGSGACQNSYMVVLCEKSVIAIPLSIPGCASALTAFIGGNLIKGDEADLSGLGVDFSDWVKVGLKVRNGNAGVFINDELILESAFPEDIGRIIGVGYRFQGTGLVDYLHLYDKDGKISFSEEFGLSE